uniref:NADH-ubiquinone oxidoreductase chain 6 n=1 Tax=Elateroidea sp. 3 KM-2017 TaxID=2219426 RepID=A0A346RFV2_9COLE|nr:NADH dehydrogenase subunit 6 [Elateroidea sp. 3 KM-2017]
MLIFLIAMNTTVIFTLTNHPLATGLTLLMQSMLIATATGMLAFNFWFSYVLFLVMVGGMLILFIYMTSVASNEKFKFSQKMLFFTLLTTIPVLLMWALSNQILESLNNEIMSSIMEHMKINNLLNKFLSFPSNWMYLLIINYLLMTLIVVVKITKIAHGPLRKI